MKGKDLEAAKEKGLLKGVPKGAANPRVSGLYLLLRLEITGSAKHQRDRTRVMVLDSLVRRPLAAPTLRNPTAVLEMPATPTPASTSPSAAAAVAATATAVARAAAALPPPSAPWQRRWRRAATATEVAKEAASTGASSSSSSSSSK